MDTLEALERHHVAENGRAFCALLAIINLALGDARLALVAILPIGISVLVAQVPKGRAWAFGVLIVYGVTALSLFMTILKLW